MAVRYYLGPLVVIGTRGATVRNGSPLLLVYTPGVERVTILKMNSSLTADRLAIHRYEASAARIALADTHPQLIPLPTDKDGRWSNAALTAIDAAGISRQAARTSTREIAQLIVSHQAGRQHDDARRVRIVMGFEDV